MARKRAVEQAQRRSRAVDRVVTVILVLLAASGLMSVLPGRSQQAISRGVCRAASLGLGSCGTTAPDLTTDTLAPPRCTILADLDAVLPEARVRTLTTGEGLRVQVSSTRAGDAYLDLGPADDSPAPLVLAGETRAERPLLAGATVPRSTEWFLPGGQGGDAVVDAVQDEHRRWRQRRSSLSLLTGLGGDGRALPPPTFLYSRVDLSEPVWPEGLRAPATPADPRPGPRRARSDVALDPTVIGAVSFDRISRETAVTGAVSGVVRGGPVTGSVRWTRDATGSVTSVLVGLVSRTPLVTGEPRAAAGSVEVTYVSVPVRSTDERTLVQTWLSSPAGFTLDLQQLLGLSEPLPSDQLSSFLTRAATVTVLRYTPTDPATVSEQTAADRIRTELVTRRRVDWPAARLALAAQVAPQANGTRRTLVTDPGCATP